MTAQPATDENAEPERTSSCLKAVVVGCVTAVVYVPLFAVAAATAIDLIPFLTHIGDGPHSTLGFWGRSWPAILIAVSAVSWPVAAVLLVRELRRDGRWPVLVLIWLAPPVVFAIEIGLLNAFS